MILELCSIQLIEPSRSNHLRLIYQFTHFSIHFFLLNLSFEIFSCGFFLSFYRFYWNAKDRLPDYGGQRETKGMVRNRIRALFLHCHHWEIKKPAFRFNYLENKKNYVKQYFLIFFLENK